MIQDGKRRARKLELSRETLRSLDAELLEQARGGMDATQDCPTWNVVTTVIAPVTLKFGCVLT